MTTNSTVSRANALGIADAASLAAKKFIETTREWRRRAASRRDLMAMGEQDLWDLRLTRADAHREANKPFWRE
jgi:uncharacterized protein YjiS (DUF1127 family)